MPGTNSASARRNITAVAINETAGYLPDPNGLQAKAQRYRRLAESLFDSRIIAVVLDCARELDEEVDELTERRNCLNDLSD